MITVLIADDQELVRTGFQLIIAAQPDMDVVGEAQSGADVVHQALRLQPDVVLMDIRMPGSDGIEATRKILAAGSPSRILILTTFDLDEYVYAGLRAGASGFLLKDTPPSELLSAIRAVASGEAVVAPAVTRRLLDRYAEVLPDPSAGAPVSSAIDGLTERELEVLRLIALGKSNAEIAAALVLSEPTIKTYVGRILLKLNVRDRVQAVVFAYENGVVKPGS